MNTSIIQKSLRLINRYNNLTKKARHYGTPFLLYPSEIHTIEVIGSQNNITTTIIIVISNQCDCIKTILCFFICHLLLDKTKSDILSVTADIFNNIL